MNSKKDNSQKFEDFSLKKIQRLSEALVFIRIYPRNQDAYVNMYYHYLRSYPYSTKNYQSEQFLASSFGPFNFIEQITDKKHQLIIEHTSQKLNVTYHINIKGTPKNLVEHSSFKGEKEYTTNFLHSLHCNNSQKFKPNLEYMSNSLN